MSQKLIPYTSCQPVCPGEGCLPQDVVFCVPFEKTVDESGFLQGSLVAQTRVTCGSTVQWSHVIQYETDDIIPNYDLVSGDISGVSCKTCAIKYLEYLISQLGE